MEQEETPCRADKQYPEQEAEVRLTIKLKQNADGSITGYVYNFEVNNYEGLLPNATQLVSDYSFRYASDKIIETTVDHILINRAR